MNVAEFGDGVRRAGGGTAILGKDVSALSVAEAARLAAVLPSPKRYSATRPGAYVQRRAQAIQRQMGAVGGAAYLQVLE